MNAKIPHWGPQLIKSIRNLGGWVATEHVVINECDPLPRQPPMGYGLFFRKDLQSRIGVRDGFNAQLAMIPPTMVLQSGDIELLLNKNKSMDDVAKMLAPISDSKIPDSADWWKLAIVLAFEYVLCQHDSNNRRLLSPYMKFSVPMMSPVEAVSRSVGAPSEEVVFHANEEWKRRVRLSEQILTTFTDVFGSTVKVSPKRLAWAYGIVVSRSHDFSFFATEHEEKVTKPLLDASCYPSLNIKRNIGEQPFTFAEPSLVPFFDLINHGKHCNVRLVDLPFANDPQKMFFHRPEHLPIGYRRRNRTLLLEGCGDSFRGKQLTLTYKSSPTALENILRYGFDF